MVNPETFKSKGYAFIEFSNYKEFQAALNTPEPIIFGKQKLVFNSAKNKYDFDLNSNSEKTNNVEILNNDKLYNISNNIHKTIHANKFSNNYIRYSTYNKENINIRIAGASEGSTNNSSNNSSYNSVFHGEKNKSKQKEKENNTLINNEIKDKSLDSQIKHALKNIAEFYGKNNPYFLNSKLCNYYCGPFLKNDFNIANNNILLNYSNCSLFNRNMEQ